MALALCIGYLNFLGLTESHQRRYYGYPFKGFERLCQDRTLWRVTSLTLIWTNLAEKECKDLKDKRGVCGSSFGLILLLFFPLGFC